MAAPVPAEASGAEGRSAAVRATVSSTNSDKVLVDEWRPETICPTINGDLLHGNSALLTPARERGAQAKAAMESGNEDERSAFSDQRVPKAIGLAAQGREL